MAPVVADHAEMIVEDLRQRRHGPGGPALSDPGARAGISVCVNGCDESGLLAGIRLSRAEIPFTILEKMPTWEGRGSRTAIPARASTLRTAGTCRL
jgi:hypothetical protein